MRSSYTLAEIAKLMKTTEREAEKRMRAEGIRPDKNGKLADNNRLRAFLLRFSQAREALLENERTGGPLNKRTARKTKPAPRVVPQISLEESGWVANGRFPVTVVEEGKSVAVTEETQSVTVAEEAALENAPSPEPNAPPQHPAKTETPPQSAPDMWDELASHFLIMIDTCSLMHRKCGSVISALLPALIRNRKKALIPRQALWELERLQGNGDAAKSSSAKAGIALCVRIRDAGCLDIRGEKGDNFADNVFFVHILHYRSQYPVLLITQDGGLANDALTLNTFQSVKGFPVRVMRITESGTLKEVFPSLRKARNDAES